MTKRPLNKSTFKPVSTATAPHALWQDVCDAWTLAGHDRLSVKQERMPPATAEEPHYHTHARQFFFVLEGTLTMRLSDGDTQIGREEGLEIAPGTAHQARNDGDTPVRFLVISTPSTEGDREPASPGALPLS